MNQILHGVHVRHFDDPPRPAHAAEGAADIPSFAEQLRCCGRYGDRTVGTRLRAFKDFKPELSRFNLGDGEVIEFEIVLVGQVVRVHTEISSGVVQNLGGALGFGQIPGRIRRLISALSGSLLGNITLRGEPRGELLRNSPWVSHRLWR